MRVRMMGSDSGRVSDSGAVTVCAMALAGGAATVGGGVAWAVIAVVVAAVVTVAVVVVFGATVAVRVSRLSRSGSGRMNGASFGTNITRYAQCVPGSRITEVLVFFADGGMSEADGGPPGFWAQGPTQRNLAFRFGFLGGMHLASFSGATDGGTCFEGVIDNVMSVPNSGAFQLCF